MDNRIFFSYERMEPLRYVTPHDVKNQLYKNICNMYINRSLSNIPLSTEIVLKKIKSKDETKSDTILLKFKVINEDWEDTRKMKCVFTSNMFKWVKEEQLNFE